MKRTNSFKLLWQAIRSSRQPMWASVQVLIVLTVVLATVFFIAEHQAQPDEYSYWRSLLWAFTQYIGDPGEFAGAGPVSLVGRLMATLIGIVGILIFAVPAGLIGSGFSSAIEDDLRKKHLEEVGDRLKKAFRRQRDAKTRILCVPRYISLGTLQAQKNMTQRDIIDAVEYNPPFRLRNLATAETRGAHAHDQLVIEMFPYDTCYGSCIDRGSNITIACPTSYSEAGIGNFSYYLALIGGFNYISKEVEPNVDEPASYYLIDEKITSAERAVYLADLRRLAGKGKERWTIFLISTEGQKEESLHFITRAYDTTGRASSIIEAEDFNRMWSAMSGAVQEQFALLSDLDVYRPIGPKNAAVHIGGGVDTNAFTIRIASELVVWDERYMAVAKTLAEAINTTVGNPDKAADLSLLKKETGLEYQK